jgi:hypothetical protein
MSSDRLNFHIDTTKKLAAQRQIDAAIFHIRHMGLECAITLAAAAERMLPHSEKAYIFSYLRKTDAYKNKQVNFNKTITWLKHTGEPDDRIIFIFEAAITVARAMTKYAAVYDDAPSEWIEFLKGYWPDMPSAWHD